MHCFRRPVAPCALLIALHMLPAHALDIDAIRVRSALGEPLVADIPLDASADELASLEASLAPAVVFARVGLPRPQGTVADLEFAIAEAQGRPVVRITTGSPAEDEFFSFLVQLDWGTGRMIREFSVALQASPPAAAPPPIQLARTPESAAPIAVLPDRPAAAPSPSPTAPAGPVAVETPAIELIPGKVPPIGLAAEKAPPIAVIPAGTARSTPAPGPPPPAAPPAPERPHRAEAARPTATAAPPHAAAGNGPAPAPPSPPPSAGGTRYGPVAAGETLSHIASRIDHAGATRAQVLAALLAANPLAFPGGNINHLIRGAELELPSAEVIASVPDAEAQRLVHLHNRAWADRQPASVAMQETLAAIQSSMAAAGATAAMPDAGGRLEISEGTPEPSENTAEQAGAAAPMPPGQPWHHESPASNDPELRHLRALVAELEASSDDMRRIIQTQDQALARAQERLADMESQGPFHAPWLKLLLAFAILAVLASVLKLRSGATSRRVQGKGKATAGAPRWHRHADGTRGSKPCKDRTTPG